MTDPNAPPYTLPPIDVVGQRRRPSGLFPAGPGGGGGGNNPGGVNQWELDEEGDPPPPPEGEGSHPCDDPETALDWNTDAAAAEALRRMLAAAAAQADSTHNLSNREYGAMICEASNGDLSISTIQWGDPIFDAEGNWVGAGSQPSVAVNFNACGSGSLPLAMIHSHPSTGPSGAIPSRPDATWVTAINSARGDNQGRIYVVSIGENGKQRIEVYDSTNVDEGSEGGVSGPEVNPDGQPCPGVTIG